MTGSNQTARATERSRNAPTTSTVRCRLVVRAGSGQSTRRPRGLPKSDAARTVPDQSSRSAPSASVTATLARTVPRPSRQSCGSNITCPEKMASPESLNGTVNVAPAPSSKTRPHTPSG